MQPTLCVLDSIFVQRQGITGQLTGTCPDIIEYLSMLLLGKEHPLILMSNSETAQHV